MAIALFAYGLFTLLIADAIVSVAEVWPMAAAQKRWLLRSRSKCHSGILATARYGCQISMDANQNHMDAD